MTGRATAIGVWLWTGLAGAQAPPTELVRPPEPTEPESVGAPVPAATPPDLVPPVVPAHVWRAERQRLKLQTALSWTFAAIGFIGVTTSLVLLGTCDEVGALKAGCPYRQGAMIAAPIFSAVTIGALVPAVLYTDRLVYHRVPDREIQLGLGPGGLLLRF